MLNYFTHSQVLMAQTRMKVQIKHDKKAREVLAFTKNGRHFVLENIVYIASTFKPSCEVTIEPWALCFVQSDCASKNKGMIEIVLGVIQIITLPQQLWWGGKIELSTSGSRREKNKRTKPGREKTHKWRWKTALSSYSHFLMRRATYLVSRETFDKNQQLKEQKLRNRESAISLSFSYNYFHIVLTL